ncbi:SMC domain protein [Pirellula staleyi DSM 6068]|uniref:SMC domain protein n=1 Tax=Pirellula staleyi (strain ATCC 27377 / DSM 6068 / ICPB 4128) TaxID=530564 RepID=D2QZ91_PIRSD|nr:AAA family ATPase [Pirellula staleyi]ADB18283.1 SMC domain protein [Pirellula staleyi DSM 6068]
MKIQEIEIDGFGAWTNLKLQELGGDATVIYGPNEAGKSTLLHFVRTVIYGFTPQRRARYVPPVYGGAPGGSIKLEGGLGHFIVHRHASMHDPLDERGSVTVIDSSGAPRDAAHLELLLGGVDEATFNNVFAIGLKEIQELGSLDDTSAADHLYKLASGLDRVSLVDVMRELGGARQRLLADGDEPGKINQLLERREKLKTDIETATTAGKRWAALAAERQSLDNEVQELEAEVSDVESSSRMVEAALEIQTPWAERQRIDQQIAAIGELRPIPEQAVEQLEGLHKRVLREKSRLKKIARRRAALEKESEDLPVNRVLVAQAPRIEALAEHAQWLVTLESQIAKLREEVLQMETELDSHKNGVQASAGLVKAKALEDLPADMMAVLRRPSQLVKEESIKLDRIRKEAEQAKQELDLLDQQVAAAFRGRGMNDLGRTIQQTGHKVALLRKRLQVEEQLDQLDRRRKELAFDGEEMSEFDETPLRVTVLLGTFFAVGVMLIGLGVVGGYLNWVDNYGAWMIFGLIMTGGSIGSKLLLERHADESMTDHRRQYEQIRNQTADAKEERDDLDAQIGPGAGSLDVRLREAEAELRELEKFVPLKSEYEAAQQKLVVLQKRQSAAEDSTKEAKHRWRTALKSVGLPEDFAPSKVREVVRGGDQVVEMRRKVAGRREELEQKEREHLVLTSRISQLVADVRITPKSDKPQLQLRQLAESLAEEKETLQHKDEILARAKNLKRFRSRCLHMIKLAMRRRQALLDLAGVTSVKAFRRVAADVAEVARLNEERLEVSRRIEQQLAGRFPEDEVSELLAAEGPSLQKKWNDRVARLEAIRNQMAVLHHRRGVCTAEMQALGSDRRLAHARLEIGMVEKQLAAAIEQWQVHGVISQALESVRQKYETERQPQTLLEASKYFTRLTMGQYQRIWMPLDKRILQVEDARGRSLSLEVLSRGTREAVYLSLRLSLVSSFARRGALLPLVMDDVIVNFDARRVEAAASLLHDFAKEGHQIIFFTCHEHIRDRFAEAEFTVRTLPARGEVVDVEPEQPKKKKKKAVPVPEPVAELPPPPPAPVIEEPKVEVDINPLLDRAYAEDLWFDPDNGWELRKLVKKPEPKPVPKPVPALNLPDSWALAPITVAKKVKEKKPKAQPAAPKVELPDSWPIAEIPRAAEPKNDTQYEVISFRYLPDSWPVAPIPPREEPKREPPKKESPKRETPKKEAVVQQPVVIPPAPAPEPKVVRKRRLVRSRFAWESPEMYWEEYDERKEDLPGTIVEVIQEVVDDR